MLNSRAFCVTSSGLRLVGDRWGEDDAQELIVLLHGGGQTRHSWRRTADRLARSGFGVVAFDARGHGDSDWDPAEQYRLDDFTADLLTVVSELGRAPIVIGASLGGMTGLLAAGEHPGSIRALVLVDVVVRIEPTGVRRIHTFMAAHRDGFASLDEVADAIVAYNPLRTRARNLDGLRKNVRLREDGRWYWHWDPAFIQIEGEPQRRVDPGRLGAAATRLRIPTLIVRGRQSDVVSSAGLADMQRLVPHAEIADVAEAGHMIAGDDNDVFVATIEDFLLRAVTEPASHSTDPASHSTDPASHSTDPASHSTDPVGQSTDPARHADLPGRPSGRAGFSARPNPRPRCMTSASDSRTERL